MNRTGRSWRLLPLTAVLAGIGLAVTGCGSAGPAPVNPPPASAHTAAERAAVMNWLLRTDRMWTNSDFVGLDQVTTGQMRTIYLSEQRQASLPSNADRQSFLLTDLSITTPCHTGPATVFVAYADTNVTDLYQSVQPVALVFERTGGAWKLATAVNRPSSGWPALCTQGTPPTTPAVLPPGSYVPALARVLNGAATGAAQTAQTASPFAVNDFLAGSGSIPAVYATSSRQDRRGGVSFTTRFATTPDPTFALPLRGDREGLAGRQPGGHAQARRRAPRDRYVQHHLRRDRPGWPGRGHGGARWFLRLAAHRHRQLAPRRSGPAPAGRPLRAGPVRHFRRAPSSRDTRWRNLAPGDEYRHIQQGDRAWT
jgi:hypothetical protein